MRETKLPAAVCGRWFAGGDAGCCRALGGRGGEGRQAARLFERERGQRSVQSLGTAMDLGTKEHAVALPARMEHKLGFEVIPKTKRQQ